MVLLHIQLNNVNFKFMDHVSDVRARIRLMCLDEDSGNNVMKKQTGESKQRKVGPRESTSKNVSASKCSPGNIFNNMLTFPKI